MKKGIDFVKRFYQRHTKLCLIILIIVATVAIIGCSANAGGGYAPSSPYVGGGCG